MFYLQLKKNYTLNSRRNAVNSRSFCCNDGFSVSRETPSTNYIILFVCCSYLYLIIFIHFTNFRHPCIFRAICTFLYKPYAQYFSCLWWCRGLKKTWILKEFNINQFHSSFRPDLIFCQYCYLKLLLKDNIQRQQWRFSKTLTNTNFRVFLSLGWNLYHLHSAERRVCSHAKAYGNGFLFTAQSLSRDQSGSLRIWKHCGVLQTRVKSRPV